MKIIKDKNTGVKFVNNNMYIDMIDEIDYFFYKMLGIEEDESEEIKNVETSTSLTNAIQSKLSQVFQLLALGNSLINEKDKQAIANSLNAMLNIIEGGRESSTTGSTKQRILLKEKLKEKLRYFKSKFRDLLSSEKESV